MIDNNKQRNLVLGQVWLTKPQPVSKSYSPVDTSKKGDS